MKSNEDRMRHIEQLNVILYQLSIDAQLQDPQVVAEFKEELGQIARLNMDTGKDAIAQQLNTLVWRVMSSCDNHRDQVSVVNTTTTWLKQPKCNSLTRSTAVRPERKFMPSVTLTSVLITGNSTPEAQAPYPRYTARRLPFTAPPPSRSDHYG
jgi:hypothetical protein